MLNAPPIGVGIFLPGGRPPVNVLRKGGRPLPARRVGPWTLQRVCKCAYPGASTTEKLAGKVGFEPTVRITAQRLSSSRIRMPTCAFQ